MMGLLDTIAPTPRNRFLGLLADAAQGVSDFAARPFGYDNPPGAIVASLLGVPAVANTLNEMSYGGALGTGSGMTWKPKADTLDAAMAVAPFIPKAAQLANTAAASVGKAVAPYVDKAVPAIMERGGLPAQFLQDLSRRTVSPVIDFPPQMSRSEKSAAIKEMAEQFAEAARGRRLDAIVEHSGSAAGPSSYVTVMDPITGAKFDNPFRFSDHSKGAFNSQFVNDARGSFGGPLDDRFISAIDGMSARIPLAERDAIQSAWLLDYLRKKAAEDAEMPFTKGRGMVFNAFKEARDSGADYSNAFSGSGKYLGPTFP